jgi:GNAT superfamily N-acetyltransferase
MKIVLVPCTLVHKNFVFSVTNETMRTYVEQAFGSWDAEMQRRRLDESFDPTTHSLIVVDRVWAGILAVEDRPAEIFVSKIFLLPKFQGQGIGSVLLGKLIERARAVEKPLRLRVLIVNRARSLYERLGFAIKGSTSEYHYMEYRASTQLVPE